MSFVLFSPACVLAYTACAKYDRPGAEKIRFVYYGKAKDIDVRIYLLFALMLSMLDALAQPLAVIDDAEGDDFGSGNLIYPQRADFHAGDLDLLRLQISRDKDGFWFEAKFKNPIADPGAVHNTNSPEALKNSARKGFYQFNLDIHIDTDRIDGSGNTATLPGRRVSIDPAYAWEKVVVLTPRPELMREQLWGALKEQFPARTDAETDAGIDKSIYFPTRIKVRGRTISFFVPADFFAGSDGTDWAVTTMVTGAITDIPADLSLFPTTKSPLERIPLGAMQPAAGHPRDTFGYSGVLPSPVVDLLGGSAGQQKQQLAVMTALTGVAWGPHAAAASASSAAAVPIATIDRLFGAANHDSAHEASSPAAANPVAGQNSIVKRLQTLQELLDQKLIDETEYKQQKQRILEEL